MKFIFSCFFISILFTSLVYAGTVSPSPRQNIMLSKNAVPDAGVGVIINASCYGTNNRGTTNPLSPNSRIFFHIKKSATEGFLIDIPSSAVTPGGANAQQSCGITKLVNDSVKVLSVPKDMTALKTSPGLNGIDLVEGLKISNLTNRVSINCIKFPISFSMDLGLDKNATFSSIQVFPTPISSQAFYGFNGLMDRGTKLTVKQSVHTSGYSDTNKFIHITAEFPGQDGFCGGYHSPLMVFFDENYPAFTGSTSLIKGEEKPTSWVEKNHTGYFLVNLKSAKETIKIDNLFGDNSEFKNGFEALAKLDKNKDMKIDKKDKVFSNLYLWKDINGNGKNDKGEIKPLSSYQILDIDLNFNNEYRLERNQSIFKGRTTFNYLDEAGKKKNGQIFDVFFEMLEK
ncbi:MAG: hypothetical protein HOP07_16635 [Bacteriovoracaceae bacterium]|nr:hypothetical protein [Bacteriovoracaceae bacterium]